MRTLWRFIAGFFKWTWRLLNFVREMVLNLFFIFLVLVGVGIWMQLGSGSNSEQTARGALLLDISGTIVDKPSTNHRLGALGRQLFGASSDRLQENSLFDIVSAIRQAKNDRNITGIVLDLKNFTGADQPSMHYIGKALREFRDSGKPVFAVGDNYTQGQYYLASFANKIWLSPQARSIFTASPPMACITKRCWINLKCLPTFSGLAPINLPLSHLFAMICRLPPARPIAAG